MNQSEYVEAKLKEAEERLGSLPGLFAEVKARYESQIETLLSDAGILESVRTIEGEIEKSQAKIQNRADVLQEQLKFLRDFHHKFLLAPIPEGVTHMYGIELAPLDPETRLRVMHGQDGPAWLETIQALGGDPKADLSPLPKPRKNRKKK